MTRQHPQSANAPKARRYGVGIPQGEPFTLTDEQLKEWRVAEAFDIAKQVSDRLDATARADQKRFFERWDDILENGLGGKGAT